MENEMTASKDAFFKVSEGVWGLKDYFVNVYIIQNQLTQKWVLVDAGLKTSASKIKKMATDLFGPDSHPECIILTHGHFDHVGALQTLLDDWNVKVYAHELELPYLTGRASYPPADPTVGGGMMAWMSDLYPISPINVRPMVEKLPMDGRIPGFADWKFIHTPGHSPGHISLWRESDRVLIAGDAFVTTKAESAISVFLQKECVSRPPAYLTYDWTAAGQSVRKLADLKPALVATGHGKPMQGEEMINELEELATHFREKAVPQVGRYKDRPAVVNASGVVFVPPKQTSGPGNPAKLAGIAGLVALGLLLFSQRNRLFSR